MIRPRRPAPTRRSVCLLGPGIEHRDSLQAMLAGRVDAVAWVPDSHSFLRQREGRPRSRLDRGLDSLLGTRDPEYLDHVLSVIDQQQAQVLVAYWGTLPLADVMAIRRARPALRVAVMLLCYPLSLEPFGIYRQKMALQAAADHLDGIICPTAEMADYLAERVFRGGRQRYAQVPPCWPAAFQPGVRPAPAGDAPNLIYVGRTDLSGSTVHAADDIRPLMRELLDAGIALYHGASKETDDGHPLRRPFPHVPISELMRRMAAHDASLIAYNTDACRRTDRFELTVPDRLLSSATAGVPIAIPRRGYAASKTYLRDYPAVLEFDRPADLHAALSDRTAMARLHDAAWGARERYTAEAQGGKLLAFLDALVAA